MNNRLRIAMFGHKRIPSREGGVEVVVEEISWRMVKTGHSVTCFNRKGHHVSGSIYDDSIADDYKGITIKRVWTVDKKGLAAMTSSLSAAIRSALGHYDIVHIHAEGPAVMCWIPRITGKRVIVTVHGLDWARSKWGGFASAYIKLGEKMAVKYADEIIVLSRAVQEYFKNTYERSTIYLPNGITLPELVDAQIITEKWGLEKDSYVLFVGRIVPEKGIEYLVEAWKSVKTDKKLVITGGSSDTVSFMEKLKSKTSENVIFTDFQQGRILEELYSNAYIFCLPSDLEGMPLSLLEAMSYGNCCVVSDIPECTEVVEDKAAVFPKGSVKDLAALLQNLIDDPSIVASYRLNAAKFICNKFNWDDITEKTLKVYTGDYHEDTDC